MKKKKFRIPAIARKAEKAMQDAVAGVIAEHQQKGLPLVVSEGDKIVWLPADSFPVKGKK
ncbi:MAG: hypothetical protein PHQ23_15295 [Candidatus Wallbacteria bacterium]|nr:hypothetical protein [Candidatus Wallbacteria bacterium]